MATPAMQPDWSPEVCTDPRRQVIFPLNYQTSDAEQITAKLAEFVGQYQKSPCILKFAKGLVRDITINNAQDLHLGRIVDFVLDHVTYLADPRGAEYVQSPVKLIREYCQRGFAQGDCDDMALLFGSLAGALGFQTRVCAVKINGSTVYNHVLNQVRIGGKWMWFDGCNKGNYAKTWDDALVVDV